MLCAVCHRGKTEAHMHQYPQVAVKSACLHQRHRLGACRPMLTRDTRASVCTLESTVVSEMLLSPPRRQSRCALCGPFPEFRHVCVCGVRSESDVPSMSAVADFERTSLKEHAGHTAASEMSTRRAQVARTRPPAPHIASRHAAQRAHCGRRWVRARRMASRWPTDLMPRSARSSRVSRPSARPSMLLSRKLGT
jgi:hypothetical protein